jgi:spore germination protein YaaH
MSSTFRRAVALVAIALLGGCGSQRAAKPVPQSTWRIGGWATYWDFPAGMKGVRQPGTRVADVFLFVAQLDGEGNPVPVSPEQDYVRAVESIRASGATAWITIVNDVLDATGQTRQKVPEVVHDVLSDPDRRRLHCDRIVALARAHHVSGIDIDYENLWPGDRAFFSAFVAELDADLAAAGMMLSVTVQPKIAETRSAGTGAADWATLCRSADRLQIMLYNEHSSKTKPGPLATPSWIDRVLSHASAQCASEKIVPAIKVIGMEWGPEGTRDVPFSEAAELARIEGAEVKRDPDGDVPWFSYGPRGERTVYYEDARSLRLKLQAVRRHGADRVVLWSIGAEDPELWRGLDRVARAPEPKDPSARAPQKRASSLNRPSADW